MAITEITAKSILRKYKKVDSWFLSCYGMNLYRGCTHDCSYCDGRAEGYRVEGEFGRDVAVKINACEILQRELDPSRKRTPFRKSFVLLGGGVGDAYQPAEKRYELTRQVLQLALERSLPVHVLTKSTLVRRDIDLLKQINKKRRAIVSFSFSSADDSISAVFEPGVPPPSQRLKLIEELRGEGIHCGMYLMPIIPFITDNPRIIHSTVRAGVDAGAEFILFSGMTLKAGRQKEHFYSLLKQKYPSLLTQYDIVYRDEKWGGPTPEYYEMLNDVFRAVWSRCKIPLRMPPHLYADLLDDNDLVAVMLEHIEYLLKFSGAAKTPYGYAAWNISQLKEPLSAMTPILMDQIKGVGKQTVRLIKEILQTGRCLYLERLLRGEHR